MLDQVVGHEPAVRLLRSHLSAPKPSYILHGPSGVGKRFTAASFFAELTCTGTKKAGCDCKPCHQTNAGTHPDLRLLTPDGQSYGIGQIQEITEDAKNYPSNAPYKVLVFDDAGVLTPNAANSLLKILEEAPPRTVFFFVLEDDSELISTIQSRSVAVKFSTLPHEAIVADLAKYSADNEKVQLCANLSAGSLSTAHGYLRGGDFGHRDEALAFLSEFPRKPYHQIISAINKAENATTLFYLLRFLFADMLLITLGHEGRVANFDKIEILKRCRDRLGDQIVAIGVDELNRLHQRTPLIKATFPLHLKVSLMKIRKGVRAENPSKV